MGPSARHYVLSQKNNRTYVTCAPDLWVKKWIYIINILFKRPNCLILKKICTTDTDTFFCLVFFIKIQKSPAETDNSDLPQHG